MPNVADRIEGLLALSERTNETFSEISGSESLKGAASLMAQIPIASISCFVLSLIAQAAGPGLGVIIAALGMATYFCKKGLNEYAAGQEVAKLKNKIDTAANSLATANPQEAVKSPRFLKALSPRFDLASAREPELNQLRAVLASAPHQSLDRPVPRGLTARLQSAR
jgi:hypothetical protein